MQTATPQWNPSFEKAAAIRTAILSFMDCECSGKGNEISREAWLNILRDCSPCFSHSDWQAFLITVRVMLPEHPSYPKIMEILERKVGETA